MLKKIAAAMIVVTCTIGAAHARSTEMYEPERVSLVAGDGKPSKQKMHEAIVSAGRHKQWVVAGDKPGTITLRYSRGKHEAVIDVDYDEKSYQIKYVSSENLNFSAKDGGKPSIHPHYNSWVKELSYGIDHAY